MTELTEINKRPIAKALSFDRDLQGALCEITLEEDEESQQYPDEASGDELLDLMAEQTKADIIARLTDSLPDLMELTDAELAVLFLTGNPCEYDESATSTEYTYERGILAAIHELGPSLRSGLELWGRFGDGELFFDARVPVQLGEKAYPIIVTTTCIKSARSGSLTLGEVVDECIDTAAIILAAIARLEHNLTVFASGGNTEGVILAPTTLLAEVELQINTAPGAPAADWSLANYDGCLDQSASTFAELLSLLNKSCDSRYGGRFQSGPDGLLVTNHYFSHDEKIDDRTHPVYFRLAARVYRQAACKDSVFVNPDGTLKSGVQ